MENHIEVETKQDKGFTLVELLIVIVILGILATVTVFAVTGITDKGKTSACEADAKTVETAEEAYSANTGSYTANQTDLVSAGLLHDESTNVVVTLIPGAAAVADNPATPLVDESAPATLETYSVAGVVGTDCEGMTF